MEKIKTTDEYVLKLLEDTQKELALVKKELAERDSKIEEVKELRDNETILVNETNYLYSYELRSNYAWNEILIKNKKTPKLLEDISKGIKKPGEFFKLRNDYSYGGATGEIHENATNYKIKFGSREVYIQIYNRNLSEPLGVNVFQVNNENNKYYLTKEEANLALLADFELDYEEYLKRYASEFKEKLEKSKEKESSK